MLRTALGLSALTGTPFEMVDIRAGRPRPGLQAQHLAAVRVVASLCNAETQGASLGSQRLVFTPAALCGGTIEHDIGTAGSIALVLQAALLPAAFAPKPVTLRLTGGTDVPWSPPVDYIGGVMLPVIRRFCKDVRLTVLRRGYYPAGGGVVEVNAHPAISRNAEGAWQRFAEIVAAKAGALVLTGTALRIRGVAHASASLAARNASARMAEAARMHCGSPADIRAEYSPAASPGGGITLWATYSDDGELGSTSFSVGADALLGSSPEETGENAARALLATLGARTLDDHLADQILPWLALTHGSLPMRRRTGHVLSNAAVIRQFIGAITATENSLSH